MPPSRRGGEGKRGGIVNWRQVRNVKGKGGHFFLQKGPFAYQGGGLLQPVPGGKKGGKKGVSQPVKKSQSPIFCTKEKNRSPLLIRVGKGGGTKRRGGESPPTAS